jgi:AraC family transcriptional regulator, regulatory protein of adaptative response / methylated-DNA-[protein]-cysteine methyltransferase
MSPDFKAPTDANWGAVSRRDRRFDGHFVYVALTTNIYCRPSCPARLPQREHVFILPTAADAERRGYSACRRCHPGANALAPAEKSIQLALEFIEGHPDTPMTLRALSQVSGLSPKHLQRVFTRIVGLSPKAFGDFRRLARVKALLRDRVPVTTAAYEAGYGSLRALYERAERGLGMTPAEYQRGGEGAHIRYALADVSLGVAVVAATEVGVCAIALGAGENGLARALADEFPAAASRLQAATMPSSWLHALREAEREDPLLLRLADRTRRDVFRANVWNALAAS